MGWVYLVRNGDLHKIGRTDHLKRRLKQLKPDAVVQVLETDRCRNLEHELHKRFKHKRLPQTEYFRLSEYEVEQVRKALGWKPPPAQHPEPVGRPLPPIDPPGYRYGRVPRTRPPMNCEPAPDLLHLSQQAGELAARANEHLRYEKEAASQEQETGFVQLYICALVVVSTLILPLMFAIKVFVIGLAIIWAVGSLTSR